MKKILRILIEIEAIKIEVEGMRQNNFIKESPNIKTNAHESLFCQGNEFFEKAEEMRSLIGELDLDEKEYREEEEVMV